MSVLSYQSSALPKSLIVEIERSARIRSGRGKCYWGIDLRESINRTFSRKTNKIVNIIIIGV
jgi:hypothetical protein